MPGLAVWKLQVSAQLEAFFSWPPAQTNSFALRFAAVLRLQFFTPMYHPPTLCSTNTPAAALSCNTQTSRGQSRARCAGAIPGKPMGIHCQQQLACALCGHKPVAHCPHRAQFPALLSTQPTHRSNSYSLVLILARSASTASASCTFSASTSLLRTPNDSAMLTSSAPSMPKG